MTYTPRSALPYTLTDRDGDVLDVKLYTNLNGPVLQLTMDHDGDAIFVENEDRATFSAVLAPEGHAVLDFTAARAMSVKTVQNATEVTIGQDPGGSRRITLPDFYTTDALLAVIAYRLGIFTPPKPSHDADLVQALQKVLGREYVNDLDHNGGDEAAARRLLDVVAAAGFATSHASDAS